MRFNKFLIPTTLINLALLSITNVVPVRAAQSDSESSIYGNWTLLYDFSCNNNPGFSGSSTITFNNDGTFNNSGNSNSIIGNWSFAGDSIIFKFTNGTTYAGIEFNNTMKGRNTTYNNLGNLRGCWTANKISGQSTVTPLARQTHSVSPDKEKPILNPNGEPIESP